MHLSGRRAKCFATVIRGRVECLWSDGELLEEDYKGMISFLGSHLTASPFYFMRKVRPVKQDALRGRAARQVGSDRETGGYNYGDF